MQAEAGYFSLTGEAGTPPARMGLSIVDMMTGLGQAFALVSAVMKARETGKGCDIDISLFDLACFNLSYLSAWYLNKGHVQERVPRSGHPSLVPCQLYRTADGWIYLMCNKEKASYCERKTSPVRSPRKGERLSPSITGPFTSERCSVMPASCEAVVDFLEALQRARVDRVDGRAHQDDVAQLRALGDERGDAVFEIAAVGEIEALVDAHERISGDVVT
jgi:hypothetical protein